MDKIKLGERQFEFEPMNINEALEAMFVLAPYVEGMSRNDRILGKLSELMNQIEQRDPNDFIRLMAYMLHIDANELIVEGIPGEEWFKAFAILLAENNASELVNAAFFLGIATSPWERYDGIRTSS